MLLLQVDGSLGETGWPQRTDLELLLYIHSALEVVALMALVLFMFTTSL